jgi:hypothetical protein
MGDLLVLVVSSSLMDGLQLGPADDGWAIVHIPPEQKSQTTTTTQRRRAARERGTGPLLLLLLFFVTIESN